MENEIYEKKDTNKAIATYLLLVFGVCYLLGLLELVTKTGKFYQILGIGFTFIPVIATFITIKITKVKARYHLSLAVWKNMKYWLLSAFVPAILVVIGTIIYFMVFPNEYSGIFEIGKRLSTDAKIVVDSPIIITLVCIVVSVLMIPIQLMELGEEIGWRGYLLGFQVEKYGKKKAVLVNGIEWGIAHLPLIYYGFNYSLDNWGAPYSNMLLMIILCVVLGIILSYVTIKTENCMYAAIIHGVVNTIGELPVYFSVTLVNGLLGPNPTGLLAMLPLIVMAVICFVKLEN